MAFLTYQGSKKIDNKNYYYFGENSVVVSFGILSRFYDDALDTCKFILKDMPDLYNKNITYCAEKILNQQIEENSLLAEYGFGFSGNTVNGFSGGSCWDAETLQNLVGITDFGIIHKTTKTHEYAVINVIASLKFSDAWKQYSSSIIV